MCVCITIINNFKKQINKQSQYIFLGNKNTILIKIEDHF